MIIFKVMRVEKWVSGGGGGGVLFERQSTWCGNISTGGRW